MYKAGKFLIVIFYFSGVVFGVELGWTGAADSSWNNPGNWSTNKVPDMHVLDDAVVNPKSNMPIVESGQSIECDDLMLGRTDITATAIMTMNGGTFQLGRHFKIGQDANTSGIFNMYGGTVNIYNTLMIAQRGTGTFNMYDGVVNVDKIWPCEVYAGKQGRGTLNMYGGTMNGNSLTFFTGTAPAIPLVNMAGGTLVLLGDQSANINTSIADGFIKAYNGSGAVKYSVAGGYTTVTGRAAVGSVTQSDGSTVVYEQGPTSDTFTVALLSQPASNVTVSVVPVDGNSISPIIFPNAAARINLAGSSGPGQPINLTFTNSNWNTPQTVTVTAVDDSIIQGQGTVLVNFNVVSSDSVFNGGGIPSVGVTVVDNDDPSGEYYDWTVTRQPELPYIHPYHQLLWFKIRVATVDSSVPDGGRVDLTLDEALELIKKFDCLSRGIPKIIYLVGWQYDGHDSKYPSWSEVNYRLKREEDANAADSLRWLMNEAFKYNTTVSLHICMKDAYENSPLWSTYLNNDLLCRNTDGTLKKGGFYNNLQAYTVCYTREWETGFAQKRIDELLEMLPIQRAGTIHIDAFHTTDSPYHGITRDQETETQRKIVRYWRSKGVDVTSEYVSANRIDPLVGLQPSAFWFRSQSVTDYLERPASLCCGGVVQSPDPQYLGRIFGQSLHYNNNTSGTLPDFIKSFCTCTLPFYYLNRYERLNYLEPAGEKLVNFADGIVTLLKDNGDFTMTQEERLLQDNNDVFIPALWRAKKEIICFSSNGYADKRWQLPPEWKYVSFVNIYEITETGLNYLEQKAVDGNWLTVSVGPGQAKSIQPVPTGDLTDDGKVDFEDLGKIAAKWLWTGTAGAVEEDIVEDGTVNFLDFALLAENWLNVTLR